MNVASDGRRRAMSVAQSECLELDLARTVLGRGEGELDGLLADYRLEDLAASDRSDEDSEAGGDVTDGTSDGEDDDRPTVVTDSFACVSDRVVDNVAESADTEVERAAAFSCGCTTYEDGPCCRQFSSQEIADSRFIMKEMTEGK